MEKVILVDQQDQAIGEEEKHQAHQRALCHRAFSVFVFRRINPSVELLLQQRQHDKYHSAGLWTNTCCGHPRPKESILKAAKRRLKEEMGFAVDLKEIGVFHYTAPFDNGLTENEIDHVLIGFYRDEPIHPDHKEITDFTWMEVNQLKQDLAKNADKYTPWFHQAFQLAFAKL